MNKIHTFQRMDKIFCVEFQRYPLKLHTNILPILWKIWFLYNFEISRAHRFKSSYTFLKFIHFHSRQYIWKCRLENGGHFVSASMCSVGPVAGSDLRGDMTLVFFSVLEEGIVLSCCVVLHFRGNGSISEEMCSHFGVMFCGKALF